jgi:hypothetical protein
MSPEYMLPKSHPLATAPKDIRMLASLSQNLDHYVRLQRILSQNCPFLNTFEELIKLIQEATNPFQQCISTLSKTFRDSPFVQIIFWLKYSLNDDESCSFSGDSSSASSR